MTFEEYAEIAKKTAVYPGIGHGTIYPVLGLGGEGGEVAEAVILGVVATLQLEGKLGTILETFKKNIRDRGGILDEHHKEKVKKELGDVLWYIWATGHEFGITLDEIARTNAEKLAARLANGTLHGSGSER